MHEKKEIGAADVYKVQRQVIDRMNRSTNEADFRGGPGFCLSTLRAGAAYHPERDTSNQHYQSHHHHVLDPPRPHFVEFGHTDEANPPRPLAS